MASVFVMACMLSLAGCTAPAAPAAPIGPVWVFEGAAAAPDRPAAEPAGALLLDGVGVEGRARLTDALGEVATRLEARHHPLVIDFVGDDLEGDAEAMARRWLPARTAARVLARGRWATRAGAVRVAARCPDGARCRPLRSPPDGLPIAAWPLAHARRLRFDDPGAAARAAAALRDRLGRPESRLALVFTAAPAVGPTPALARQVRRVLRRLPDDRRLRRLIDGLVAPASAARPPWWPPPGEVMVVPRLSALAAADAVDAEIAAALSPAPRG